MTLAHASALLSMKKSRTGSRPRLRILRFLITTITTTTGGIYSVTENHGAENEDHHEGRPPGQAGSFSLELLSARFGGSFHTGLERYSLHAEFDQNTMRDSGNVKGIQDCYPERGICQNLGTDVSNFRLHF